MTYEVGDRVKVRMYPSGIPTVKYYGTVTAKDGSRFKIRFDREIDDYPSYITTRGFWVGRDEIVGVACKLNRDSKRKASR